MKKNQQCVQPVSFVVGDRDHHQNRRQTHLVFSMRNTLQVADLTATTNTASQTTLMNVRECDDDN